MTVVVQLSYPGRASINLNNQSTHWVDAEGLNVGNRQTSWEEVFNYAGGANQQVNVQRGALIPVMIPMRVQGYSLANLKALLDDLWVLVEAPSMKVPGALTLYSGGDTEVYSIVSSSRPEIIERGILYQNRFIARFTLVLTRLP